MICVTEAIATTCSGVVQATSTVQHSLPYKCSACQGCASCWHAGIDVMRMDQCVKTAGVTYASSSGTFSQALSVSPPSRNPVSLHFSRIQSRQAVTPAFALLLGVHSWGSLDRPLCERALSGLITSAFAVVQFIARNPSSRVYRARPDLARRVF